MMIRVLISTSLSCVLLAPGVMAQVKGKAAPTQTHKSRQYKRIHQEILKPLLRKNIQKAEQRLQLALEANPDDPETRFMETLVTAARGDTEASLRAIRKALALGLPPERLVAGPRELFAPIAQEPAYRKLLAEYADRLVHGPVLGHLTESQVHVWVRTSRATPVHVTLTPRTSAKVVRAEGRTYAGTDFTCTVKVQNLQPLTEYDYTVSVGEGQPIQGGSFKTLHRPTDLGKLTVAFGGGAGYVPQHERMWTTIGSFDPDLLLLLGDNIYSDAPTLSAMQRYCYYRRQSRSEFRHLVANTPVYAIWDDHDFGTNDCHGGPLPDKPPWKKDVYKVFSQNWPNPYFGIQDAPGCFFDFYAGNVYFILLDGRCFRENPKNSDSPSMLGQLQLAWLKGRLSARNDVFKVICSPVPWSFETKNDSLDTWNGFREERNEIFAFLTRIRMEGVLLLSADRHRTDIWKLDRPKVKGLQPYPLIELSSSRLTNQHVHPELKAAEFSYNKKQSFGLVDIDTGAEDPKIMFKVINIDGEIVHTKTILYSSLCFQ